MKRHEPVCRRLPDGRPRFRWEVHTAYRAARREDTDPPVGD